MVDVTPDHVTDVVETEEEHTSGGVTRRPVTIVRGRAARLWDDRGNEYIDCASGHGWANIGHCHPEVVAAIHKQAGQLVAMTESGYNDQRAAWYRMLARILASHFDTTERGTLSRIFPCNSGTEAVEAAMKFARFRTQRTNFVAFHRGFHGRTLGALSVTSARRYRASFEPLLDGITHVHLNDADAVDSAVNDKTAGVILEIIQGEGGVHEAAADFIAGVQRICSERGALLMVDEIQTGFGRTGRWFASAHAGAEPDVIMLGKALGSGIPMGAAVWRSELGQFDSGLHGSTFGGAPLACAASVAGMRVLEREALPERAATLGAELRESLTSCAASVREVRGRGLMIGVELRTSVMPVLRTLLDRGVWALPAGKNVLRLLPPLVISEQELSRATAIVIETLRAL